MNKNITDRICYLIKSTNVQKDISFLVALQLEQAPWLTREEALDCVVFSLVKHYSDYQLSFMWHKDQTIAYMNSKAA